MMRRRKNAILASQTWNHTSIGRFLTGSVGAALVTPRAGRISDLVDLPGAKTFLDIGAGTAAYARLVAEKSGTGAEVICMDIADGDGVDIVGWPEHLPFADKSIDSLTSLHFIRRFDDDVVHNFGTEISRVLAPGGSALVVEVAPVHNEPLNRWNSQVVAPGCAEVDLRGWGRLAALFTECEFDAIDLVNVGPFFLPPVPRVGVLLRRS